MKAVKNLTCCFRGVCALLLAAVLSLGQGCPGPSGVDAGLTEDALTSGGRSSAQDRQSPPDPQNPTHTQTEPAPDPRDETSRPEPPNPPAPDEDQKSSPPEASRATGCNLLSREAYNALPAAPPTFAAGTLPSAADLTAEMPPVGDQGGIGSCVAWAAGYAVASHNANKVYDWGFRSYDSLASPAWLYGRTLEVEGRQSSCGDGTFPADALGIMVNEGCPSWTSVPYSDQQCFFNVSAPDKANFRIASFQAIKPANDHNKIRSELADGKPVVIAVMLKGDFQNYRSGVYRADAASGDLGGHAMVIVGYNDSRGAYRIMNSWGTGWGENGYLWWAYDDIGQYLWEAYTTQPLRSEPQPGPRDDEEPRDDDANTEAPHAEFGETFQLYYVDYWGIPYVYIIFEYSFSEPVFIRSVTMVDPYGGWMTDTYGQWFQHDLVAFWRADGYQWHAGTYTLYFDVVLRDGREMTYSGEAYVAPLEWSGSMGSKRSKAQRRADKPAGITDLPPAGITAGVVGPTGVSVAP